jgi:hypothetical protein
MIHTNAPVRMNDTVYDTYDGDDGMEQTNDKANLTVGGIVMAVVE